MSKVDYRPQQNNTAYWRNVANLGRGSQMTQCLHEACDYIAKLETDRTELMEALRGLATVSPIRKMDRLMLVAASRALLERMSK